jgi:hypothetical protein
MKLQDCHMQLRSVVTPPFEHDAPGADWREVRAAGHIPPQLWDLYRATRYLSASALAGFETPNARIITVYFARLIRSVKECLLDSAELRTQMRDLSARQYDPRKPYPHEFDRDAARRHRSAFRSLLVNLVGSLDVFADIVAVMLPRQVPHLRAGGAAFTVLERWLATRHEVPSGLISPTAHFVAELHEQLGPIVVISSGPERDWLPLMRMYRNKAAHLGHQSYTQFGLESKIDGNLAFFIPRSWPFVAEQYAAVGPPSQPTNEPVDFSDVLSDWLMHQDLEEYSEGAFRKIHVVLGAGFGALHRLYMQLKAVPVANATLEDLEKSKLSYKFEYFENAG